MKVINDVWNTIMLKRKKVTVGQGLILNGRIHIHGRKDRVVIGDHCKINSDQDANPTAGGHPTHLTAGNNGRLRIGNNVGISYAYIVAYESVTIEDNVLIGADVKIWDTDFHPIGYRERVNKEKAQDKPVLIKEGAFIGACCIILKGVTIGRHSVVGAGSVVSHDIPDGEIWAGNPARRIRKIEE